MKRHETSSIPSKQFASKRPPEERPLSHHDQPASPGSDHNHTNDEEKKKEDKRVWDELHKVVPPKKPK